MVQCIFWSDSEIQEFTPEDKLFYLYLLTNEHSRQCGISEISIKRMAFETGYSKETIETLISRFEQYGKIKWSPSTNEVALKNWRKYNADISPKVKACINKELILIKNKTLLVFLGYATPDAVRFNPNYRVSDKLRTEIFQKYNNKCQKCNSVDNLSIDHIIPRSLGGTSVPENLRCLCRSCNSKRPLQGEELRIEIENDGFDFNALYLLCLEKAYEYPIGSQTQEEEEREEEYKNKEKENNKNTASPENILLAQMLFSEMLKNDAKRKSPNFEKWANDFRLLKEQDDRTNEEEIKSLIILCQKDGFWKAVILSAANFRKHYTKLLLINKNGKRNGATTAEQHDGGF